jgi:probable rRNA maturation factor
VGKALTLALLGVSKLPASARRPDLIKKAVRLALGKRANAPGELNVLFVSDAEIRRLNKRHLGHDYSTDVIAFPYDPPLLGDVVVSADTAKRQAKELGHPVLEEVLTLAAHGALHLMGYDDHRPTDKAKMFNKQSQIVRKILTAVRSQRP